MVKNIEKNVYRYRYIYTRDALIVLLKSTKPWITQGQYILDGPLQTLGQREVLFDLVIILIIAAATEQLLLQVVQSRELGGSHGLSVARKRPSKAISKAITRRPSSSLKGKCYI